MHLHFLEVYKTNLSRLFYTQENISGGFTLQKAGLAWDEQLLLKFYKKALDYDADSLFFNLAVQVIKCCFYQ